MSSVASSVTTSTMSSTRMRPSEPALFVDDGHRREVVVPDEVGDLLLVHRDGDGLGDRSGDGADAVVVCGEDQRALLDPALADDPRRRRRRSRGARRPRPACGGSPRRRRATVWLAHGPDQLRLHDAAGAVLGVLRQELAAVRVPRLRDVAQDLGLLLLVEVEQEVGRVVRVHLGDQTRRLGGVQRVEQLVALLALLDVAQHRGALLPHDRAEGPRAILGAVEHLDDVRDLRRLEQQQEATQVGLGSFPDQAFQRGRGLLEGHGDCRQARAASGVNARDDARQQRDAVARWRDPRGTRGRPGPRGARAGRAPRCGCRRTARRRTTGRSSGWRRSSSCPRPSTRTPPGRTRGRRAAGPRGRRTHGRPSRRAAPAPRGCDTTPAWRMPVAMTSRARQRGSVDHGVDLVACARRTRPRRPAAGGPRRPCC